MVKIAGEYACFMVFPEEIQELVAFCLFIGGEVTGGSGPQYRFYKCEVCAYPLFFGLVFRGYESLAQATAEVTDEGIDPGVITQSVS